MGAVTTLLISQPAGKGHIHVLDVVVFESYFSQFPPAQGYASPSRKLVLLPIDHNYTVGGLYMYRLPVFNFISYGARINQ